MKSFIVSCGWLLVLFLFSFAGVAGGEEKKRSVDTGGESIQDTVYMKLEAEEESICVDSAVFLKCPEAYKDEDILYYKWTNNITDEVYTTRNIWVSPRDTVTYTLEIAYVDATHNLIRNGDFEEGPEGRHTFYTEYTYITSEARDALYPEGVYKMAQNPHRYHPDFSNLPDHTSGRGHMMVINGNISARIIVWKQEIGQIRVGQQYAFSAWAATVSKGAQPLLHFSINHTSLSDESLSQEFKPPFGAGWQRFYYIWTADKTEASISLVDMSMAKGGNDFALDDLSFVPVKLLFGHTKIKILPRLELNKLGGVCEGEGMPHVIGTGITSYEWKKTGTDWSSREAQPDLSGLGGNVTGEYTCKIKGYCDEKQDTFRILPVLQVGSFRDTVTLCPGKKDTLVVKAEGPEVRYSWRDPDIGKFLSDRSFYPVEMEGRYECKVESVCGSRSLTAVVNRIPVWTERPRDTVVCTGEEVVWTVGSSLKQAVPEWTLPDNSVYRGHTLKPVLAGTYFYRIAGCGGEVLEGEVTLGLHPFPGIPDFPEDTLRNCEGSVLHLASPFKYRGLTYTWTHNGRAFSVDTAFSVTLTSADTGWYALKVRDACGITQKDSVYVSLFRSPVVKAVPGVIRACPGDRDTLLLSVEGDVKQYSWDRGLAEEERLIWPDITYADSGVYRCEVTGYCGEKETVESELKILRLPEIVSLSDDALIKEGEDYRLEATAKGDSIQYRWFKNGELYPGEEAFLVFQSVSYADSGWYRVELSNRCGEAKDSTHLQTRWELWAENELLEVCEGTDTVLRASVADPGGLLFTWYYGDRPLTGRISDTLVLRSAGRTDFGTYRCVVKGRGWKDTVESRLVVMDSLQILNFRGDVFLCEGSPARWTVRALGEELTYAWAGGDGWQVEADSMYVKDKVEGTDAGRYECTVSSRCGERKMIRLLEVGKKIRFLTKPSDTVVCTGNKVIWKAEATVPEAVIRWWAPDGEVYTGPEIILNGTQGEEGIWKYRGESACDTTEVYTVRFAVHPFLGKLRLSPDSVRRCPGESLRWAAPFHDPGLHYLWTKEGAVLAEDSVLVLPELSVTGEGYYRLKITDACGLSQADSIRIAFFPALQVQTDGGVLTSCVGDSLMLRMSASGVGLQYSWNRPGGQDSNYCLEKISAASAGEYVCTVTDRCGQKESRTWNLVVNSLPQIRFNLPPWVGACRDTLQLTGIHPFGGMISVNGKPADYLRLQDDQNEYRILYDYQDPVTHCRDTASYTIRVDQAPLLVLQEDTVTGVCRPVPLSIREATRGQIRWFGDGNRLQETDPWHAVYVPGTADTGIVTYTASLTDVYGCIARDTVRVRVFPSPVLQLLRDTVLGSCKDLILAGEYRGEGIGGISWKPEKAVRPLDAYRGEVTRKKVGKNVYSAEVRDRFGCEASDTVVVMVVESVFPQDREVCVGDTLRVDLSGFAGYDWEDDYGNAVRLLQEAGEYFCRVRDRYGCTASVMYEVHPLPVFTLRDTFIFEGEDFRLVPEFGDESYGPYRIQWWDGQEGTESSEIREAGTYRIEISDRSDCRKADSAYVDVRKRAIAAPDAFLPASTGENSRFYLKEVNFVHDFTMYIYNRWGELVFKTRQIGFNGGWDGTFKGTDCLPGAYLWVAVSDGQVLGRGTVMLVK